MDNLAQNQTTPAPIENIPSQPPTPKNEFPKWVIILTIILLLVVIGVFAYQNYLLKQQIDYSKTTSSPRPSVINPSVVPSTTSTPDPTADWETYQSQDNFLTFRYPKELENLIFGKKVKQFDLSIKSKQEIMDEYKKYEESGCPSTCGMFVNDPDLLQKQFDVLDKIANSPDCTLSIADKEEIENNFILFTGGIGNKYQVETVKNANDKCGLKIIESDGFDVSLGNFYYKVGFLINDKIVDIKFNIFPYNVSKEVDDLWTSIGFDLTNLSCDATCGEKEIEYFKKFSINNKIEKQMISTYNQIISTLDFTN